MSYDYWNKSNDWLVRFVTQNMNDVGDSSQQKKFAMLTNHHEGPRQVLQSCNLIEVDSRELGFEEIVKLDSYI